MQKPSKASKASLASRERRFRVCFFRSGSVCRFHFLQKLRRPERYQRSLRSCWGQESLARIEPQQNPSIDQQKISGMLLPCRFCTRMSLICPINSSRSNQSSQPRPAIRSRAQSRLDPGSIAHKAPPGGGRRGGGGCCSGREPAIVQPCRAGHAQADINGRDTLHQRTWPRLTAASSVAERATTRGGEVESRADERPSGEQLQHLVGISEVGGVPASTPAPPLTHVSGESSVCL